MRVRPFLGDTWDALVLTETEREAVTRFRETGEWAHCDGVERVHATLFT